MSSARFGRRSRGRLMSSTRFGRRSKLGPGQPLAWGKSPPPKVATGRTGRVFPVRRRRNLGGGGNPAALKEAAASSKYLPTPEQTNPNRIF